jgi:hypothetical protein
MQLTIHTTATAPRLPVRCSKELQRDRFLVNAIVARAAVALTGFPP